MRRIGLPVPLNYFRRRPTRSDRALGGEVCSEIGERGEAVFVGGMQADCAPVGRFMPPA